MKDGVKITLNILDFHLNSDDSLNYRFCWKKLGVRKKKKFSKKFTKGDSQNQSISHSFKSQENCETEIVLLVQKPNLQKIKIAGTSKMNMSYYSNSPAKLFRQKVFFENCPDKNAFVYFEIRKDVVFSNLNDSTQSSLNDTLKIWNTSLLSVSSSFYQKNNKNEYYLKQDISHLNKENNNHTNLFSEKELLPIKDVHSDVHSTSLKNIENPISVNFDSKEVTFLENIVMGQNVKKSQILGNVERDKKQEEEVEKREEMKITFGNKELFFFNQNDSKKGLNEKNEFGNLNKIKKNCLKKLKMDILKGHDIKNRANLEKKKSSLQEDFNFSEISSLNKKSKLDYSFHSKNEKIEKKLENLKKCLKVKKVGGSVKNSEMEFSMKSSKNRSEILQGSRMTFSNIDFERDYSCCKKYIQETIELNNKIELLLKDEKQLKNEIQVLKKDLEKNKINFESEVLALKNELRIAGEKNKKNEQKLKLYDLQIKMEKIRSNKKIDKDVYRQQIKDFEENLEDFENKYNHLKIENEKNLKELSDEKEKKKKLELEINEIKIKFKDKEKDNIDFFKNTQTAQNLILDLEKEIAEIKKQNLVLKMDVKRMNEKHEKEIINKELSQQGLLREFISTRKKIADCLDFLGEVNLKKIEKKTIIEKTIDILVKDE